MEKQKTASTLKEALRFSLLDGIYEIFDNVIIVDRPVLKWPFVDYLQDMLTDHNWTIEEISYTIYDTMAIICRSKGDLNE